jgi:hypothetical protein
LSRHTQQCSRFIYDAKQTGRKNLLVGTLFFLSSLSTRAAGLRMYVGRKYDYIEEEEEKNRPFSQ